MVSKNATKIQNSKTPTQSDSSVIPNSHPVILNPAFSQPSRTEPVGVSVAISKIEAGIQTDIAIQTTSYDLHEAEEVFMNIHNLLTSSKLDKTKG